MYQTVPLNIEGRIILDRLLPSNFWPVDIYRPPWIGVQNCIGRPEDFGYYDRLVKLSSRILNTLLNGNSLELWPYLKYCWYSIARNKLTEFSRHFVNLDSESNEWKIIMYLNQISNGQIPLTPDRYWDWGTYLTRHFLKLGNYPACVVHHVEEGGWVKTRILESESAGQIYNTISVWPICFPQIFISSKTND